MLLAPGRIGSIGLARGAGAGPAWAVGADLWKDFTRNAGNMPDPVDTHAATIYAPNAAGVWQPFAPNALTRTDLGLQTVPTRTNSLRNNSGTGAVPGVVGSGGSLPSGGWSTPSVTWTTTVIGTGTDANGLPYIDIRFQHVDGTGGSLFLNMEATNQIVAANAQTWAYSSYILMTAGSIANISSIALNFSPRDAGGSGLPGQISGSDFKTSVGTQVRQATIGTLSNASTARVLPFFQISSASTGAIDITLRFTTPQMEQGAFASPPILTTSAAAQVNGNLQVVSGLGDQLATGVAGLVQFNILQPAENYRVPLIFNRNAGDLNNAAFLYGTSAGTLVFEVRVGGVAQASVQMLSGWSQGIGTVAFVAANNYVMARRVGGAAPTPDTAAAYPTSLDRAAFGGMGFNTNENGYQFTRKAAFDFLTPGDDPATKFAEWFAKAELAAAA